jgi:peroxiredoxin
MLHTPERLKKPRLKTLKVGVCMKSNLVWVALCASFVLVSCQGDSEIESLKEEAAIRDQKIQALEERIVIVEQNVKSQAQKAAEKRAAQGLLSSAQTHAATGNIEEAKKNLKTLIETYPMAVETLRAQQDLREINLLGQDAGEINAEKWFTGNAKMSDGIITVLIFWRAFDPYSQSEVIKLEERYQKYQGKGLNLIGVTAASSLYTDERFEAFISELKLTFPMAKDNAGAMSKRYAVNTVPAAAMVKNGKIVWRGHPSRLKDEFIEKWLEPTIPPNPFAK